MTSSRVVMKASAWRKAVSFAPEQVCRRCVTSVAPAGGDVYQHAAIHGQ